MLENARFTAFVRDVSLSQVGHLERKTDGLHRRGNECLRFERAETTWHAAGILLADD